MPWSSHVMEQFIHHSQEKLDFLTPSFHPVRNLAPMAEVPINTSKLMLASSPSILQYLRLLPALLTQPPTLNLSLLGGGLPLPFPQCDPCRTQPFWPLGPRVPLLVGGSSLGLVQSWPYSAWTLASVCFLPMSTMQISSTL